MTSSAKPTFLPLAKLPRTPASDLKKLGWRGMMSALRSKGTLLVTNHDEPEAVIISVPEYDALMHLVEQSETQTESALAGLRLPEFMRRGLRAAGQAMTMADGG